MRAPRHSTRSSLGRRLAPVIWIAAVALGAGACLLLHHMAQDGGGLSAQLGQVLVPLVCIVVAAVLTRAPRRGGAASRLTLDQIHAQLRVAFQGMGYQLAEDGAGNDRDGLVLRRGRETFLVWAKPWAERRVGADAVQQLCRAMAARGAVGGFVVTTGRFGRDATTSAAAHNVRLIDGRALRDLLARADPA